MNQACVYYSYKAATDITIPSVSYNKTLSFSGFGQIFCINTLIEKPGDLQQETGGSHTSK